MLACARVKLGERREDGGGGEVVELLFEKIFSRTVTLKRINMEHIHNW